MKPTTLRELIMVMEAENGGAINKTATIGQLLAVATMIQLELNRKADIDYKNKM